MNSIQWPTTAILRFELMSAIVMSLICDLCPVLGTNVEPMPMTEAADHAAAVVVGTIVDLESRWTVDPPGMQSVVTLENVEYLKGTPTSTASSFHLTVPGGTIGETSSRIAGAPDWKLGERWILFVLPEYRTFPIVGIWEGAFRVREDSLGNRRVFDVLGSPILGIDGNGFIIGQRNQEFNARFRLRETRSVEVVETGGKAVSVADSDVHVISYESFVAQLRPILENSRQYPDSPIGRPVPVHYTPVPLRPSLSAFGSNKQEVVKPR